MTHTRPTWTEISRSSLLGNYTFLRSRVGAQAVLLSVVKANAYGHGLADCAQALAAEGCRWFGVTSTEEGVALRKVCPDVRILLMSGLWEGEAETAIEQNLTPVVWEQRPVHWMEEAAQKRGAGPGTGRPTVSVHLEIDTGMSRQGVQVGGLPALLDCFASESPVRPEAVMTHFHSPEAPEPTVEQIRHFETAVDTIVSRGLKPDFLSAGSSADLLDAATAAITALAGRIGAHRMLRAGLSLYGYTPGGEVCDALRPVLSWKTRVTGLRDIEAGTTVGYGATFRAQRRTRLALLPVGYADGFNRLLSSRGSVLIRGQRAPIAGRISMDQTMVDITDIAGAERGDEAVLIGQQGHARITAADLAREAGTIPYEVLCAISARVPRAMVE